MENVQFKFPLGFKVKCKLTDFLGVTTCRTQWLTGEVNYGVQPAVSKDGTLGQTKYIEESRLELEAIQNNPDRDANPDKDADDDAPPDKPSDDNIPY